MVRNFAICRVEKRKNLAQVKRSEGHNFRTITALHVDSKAPSPKLLFGSKGLTALLNKILPEKRRKDAVLAFEVLLTASPEWFEGKSAAQIQEWADANTDFLNGRFGTNLMQVVLHLDEQTPHIHAYCHPVRPDGALSYKRMLGSPELLSELQDDYALAMKPMGLRRGLAGRKATYEETRHWRAEQAHEIQVAAPTDADVPRATMQDRINPEPYVKNALERFWRKINRQLSKLMTAAADGAMARKENAMLLARLNALDARVEAEAERANFYKAGLAMLLGFEPEIDTLEGQAKAIKAIKELRLRIHGPDKQPRRRVVPIREPAPAITPAEHSTTRKTMAPTPFGSRSTKH